MANFLIFVHLASPLWALALPFISANRIYLWGASALCFLLFTVEPVWTSARAVGSDSGVGLLLSLATNALAVLLAAILLAATRTRHRRVFFGTMLCCAVAGILGAIAIRL